MPRLLLIVDLYPTFGFRLETIARSAGWDVIVRQSFVEARQDIAAFAPAMLVTALRLGDFNGIHLVHLSKLANPRAPCVVYGEAEGDVELGREAQRAGAFYERRSRLPFALRRYLTADLPTQDRRDIRRPDRRTEFRGGRRSTDLAVLHGGRNGSELTNSTPH
jgi:DNA-binding NtrC family response regulator